MAKPKDLKQFDMVAFVAIDHTTTEDGWMSLPDAMNEAPCMIEGIGFFIGIDEVHDVIKFTNSHINNEDVATLWSVPLGCLLELYILKSGKVNYAQRKGSK
jgi:hypothetical protein